MLGKWIFFTTNLIINLPKINYMKRTKLFLTCILLAVTAVVNAQNLQVKGTVTDANGEGIPFASVQVQGTMIGTSTDAEGHYVISSPANGTLVFSSMGFKSVALAVDGKAVVNCALNSDTEYLDEVVVTALGITKSEKSLGYSATTVKSDEITISRSSDAMNSIAGKVAGVQISQSSPTAGSASSVIIRGVSSISGNNQPLYVVDGVPLQSVVVDNTLGGNGNVAAGIGSINPDDIESMTILKGAAATALYGSRASGGVIIVNTKSGSKQGRTRVTVNAGMQFSSVATLPEFQNKFGTGWDGVLTLDENGSWGPIMDGNLRAYGPVIDNSQMIKNYQAVPNNIRNFYDTGIQYNVGASLEGGNDKTNYYLSYAHVGDDGILPSNKDKYDRNTITMRGSHQAFKWLKLSSNLNFSTQKTSQVEQESTVNSVLEGLYQSGRDISFIDSKDQSNPFYRVDGWYTPYSVTNPYWIIDNSYNVTDMKKVFGKIQADITPIKQLTITYRYGLDYTDYDKKLTQTQVHLPASYANSGSNQDGMVTNTYGRYCEQNHDFLVNYKDMFLGGKFELNATVGANINERKSTAMNANITGLTFDTGFWDLSNTSNNPVASEAQSLRRSFSVFGDVTLGWDDQVFLDLTARNDWSSTLPMGNNSYFYPGATASWIFTKTFGLDKTAFNFGKLRVAYGKTGNDPGVYMTNATYAQAEAGGYFGAGTPLNFPFAGYNGYMQSATLASSTLQPEMTTEFEVGANLQFFSGRLGLDATYYNRISDHQIFSLPVDPATGYTSMNMNFGEVKNAGVELLLTTVPVKTKNWQWTLDFNWSKNNNTVLSLPAGLDGNKALINRDGWGDVYMYAEVGKPIGELYATLPQRTEDGKVICDKNGCPVQGAELEDTGFSVQNLWTGGITTSLSYKDITLSATLDVHYGGKMYSRTKSILWFTGNTIETTYNERRDFIVPNSVVEVAPGEYVENTTPISQYTSTFQYYYAGNDNRSIEGSAYDLIDRSYAKLRNITLSYSLPKKWMEKIRMEGIVLSVVGNNLFTWTPASNCYIDPDQGYTTDLDGMLGEYFCQPSCRYIGFNVKVTF